ncbi:hypothetical protein Pla163_02180 [Planctomycetes bacterium Pla163]|uniref:DUF3817 domain-containing protein n=1 Tax=Rohdeia mirabilis TaxID=2528008 RepID=A0A518CV67_9BACT|nr:hypothetical protein Pla163_02180 [Planctomycetes bacterium Pla163]
MTARIDHTYLRRLRRLSYVEAVSTLVLFFVAMPLKYLADMPLAVTVVGSMHGFLFVALVIALAVATLRVPISRGLALGGMVGAVVPFGPFVVDRWLERVENGVGDGGAERVGESAN